MFDSVLTMPLDIDPAVKKDKPIISFQKICKINRKENAESLKAIALTETNSGNQGHLMFSPVSNRVKT